MADNTRVNVIIQDNETTGYEFKVRMSENAVRAIKWLCQVCELDIDITTLESDFKDFDF